MVSTPPHLLPFILPPTHPSRVLFSCLVLLRHVELALFLESRPGEALRE
jgi:hypothetical protein